MFKKGAILNELGVKALKIYLANSYGLDPKSYDYRLNWVEENLSSILNIETNMWLKAKEKLLLLAAALEFKGSHDDPKRFISRLPIYLDATCSGLQHLATMANDLNLAKYSNILESSQDPDPKDVYSLMVLKLQNKLNSLAAIDPTYSNLTKININRKFIKRGIMTIPYGVTIRGIKEQLVNDFYFLLELMININGPTHLPHNICAKVLIYTN